jgi:antitoxin PrlF
VHSTVTKKGQTTIPGAVRKALGIKPGDRLQYSVEGNVVTIRVHPGARSLSGALAIKEPTGKSIDEIRAELAKRARRNGGRW